MKGGREGETESRSEGERVERRKTGWREREREGRRVHTQRGEPGATVDDGRSGLPFPLHGNPARTHSAANPGRGTPHTDTRGYDDNFTSLSSARLQLRLRPGHELRGRAADPARVTHDIRPRTENGEFCLHLRVAEEASPWD